MSRLDLADLRQMTIGKPEGSPARGREQGLHLFRRRMQIGDLQRVQRPAGGKGKMLAVGQAIEAGLGNGERAGLAPVALVFQTHIRLVAGRRGDMDRDRLVAEAAAQNLDGRRLNFACILPSDCNLRKPITTQVRLATNGWEVSHAA